MLNKWLAKILFVAIVIVAFLSCKDNSNNYRELRANELELLDQYLSDNGITQDPTGSGLYYLEVVEGAGDSIKNGDRIQIFYETYLIDSALVDASGDYSPLEYIVGNGSVVAGLDEISTYMKPGGEANIILPSEVAYGSSGSDYIGSFQTLLMNIKIHRVYPAEDSE